MVFTPTDIDTIAHWWRPEEITNTPPDTVEENWVSAFGGVDLIKVGGTFQRPTLIADYGPNNLIGVSYDSNDDFDAAITIDDPATFFIATALNGDADPQSRLCGATNNDGDQFQIRGNGGSLRFYCNGVWGETGIATADTDMHLYCVVLKPSTGYGRVDGVQTTGTDNNWAQAFANGLRVNNFGGNYERGSQVAPEILIYTGELSIGDIESVENYLKYRWQELYVPPVAGSVLGQTAKDTARDTVEDAVL